MNRRLALAAALAVLAGGCGGDAGVAPGPWVAEADRRWRPLTVEGSGGLTRLDASRHGIGFVYDVAEERRLENRVLVEGAGVAIGDVDGDGLADLFFAGFTGRSALYRNRGGWRFEEVTDDAGVALADVAARGAALADVDGDGDPDLVVTVHAGPVRLLLNDGEGRFAPAADAGFSLARGSTSPALADIDGDADLDLYVANYKTRQADDLLRPDQLAELQRLRPGPDGQVAVPDFLAAHYRVEFDGRFVRWWELGEVDELYLNAGDGTFRHVPPEEWLREPGPEGRPDGLRDWGLAARFSDWDGDGDPDLYVANDFNSPDGIWLNRGDGTFDAAASTAIRTTSLSSMAVAVGDVERDGDLDLVTTDMLARERELRLTQVPSFVPEREPPGEIDTRVQVNRNTLQLNRGDRTFAEAAFQAGLEASDWTWGAIFLDADLDGFEDLLVTTGHVWNQLDGDADERLRMRPPGAGEGPGLDAFPPLPQPNAAFRGRGDGTFEDVTASWGWGSEDDISHGLATGDLDADGDLDVVVTRLGAPPLLVRNESPEPRVLVRLRGPSPNTRGIGARVILEGHAVGPQVGELAAGGVYLSSSEPALMFAASGDAMNIEVYWPDGRRTHHAGILADREYELRHPDARSDAGGPEPGGPRPGDAGAGTEVVAGSAETLVPLFEDVSDALGHTHVETPFDDFARQPLLPASLARQGPALAWSDADGDGRPDLFVGAGRGGAPVLIRNRGDGVFDPPRALTDPLGFDAHGLLAGTAGIGTGSTGPGLLIAGGGYEAATPAEILDTPALLAVRLAGAGTAEPREVLGGTAAVSGPLARADIDGDGDLDVFVGGRVVPAVVPLPPDSRLLLNEGGALLHDSTASAPFAQLGLVSGAVFTDFDADGDPDLALATEWGPIRLFRNDGGRFEEATAEAGLEGTAGRWNGVTAGDFDGDGAMDLAATGWGTNTEWPARFSLFHGDFDRNGSYDLIAATREPSGWMPLLRRDELARGIPAVRRTSFEAYGRATVAELLGPAFDSTARVDVEEPRHLVLLNRSGRFEPRPLPPEAQRAPAFGLAAADFDGDGREDLVLAQNFYAGRPGTPRYDAGRSLWLRGDGAGGFEAVSGPASGIAVYGDARAVAVADFDADRRADVAIGVNGGPTRLFRNATGRPGLEIALAGPPGNPEGVGASLRVVYADGSTGPVREIRAGEGYWGQSSPIQILGLAGTPAAVRVRWPGGAVTETPVENRGRLEIRAPGRPGGDAR